MDKPETSVNCTEPEAFVPPALYWRRVREAGWQPPAVPGHVWVEASAYADDIGAVLLYLEARRLNPAVPPWPEIRERRFQAHLQLADCLAH